MPSPTPADRSREQEPRAFATSNWSMIARAGAMDSDGTRAALAELCRIYWYPLYWFTRSRGLSQHDAEDLIQAFFEDLLRRNAIARADVARGRFRPRLARGVGLLRRPCLSFQFRHPCLQRIRSRDPCLERGDQRLIGWAWLGAGLSFDH